MSTLMNYTYHSFALCGWDAIRPYYALISNVAAEEGGHIESVSAAINSCLNGPRDVFDQKQNPTDATWKNLPGRCFRRSLHRLRKNGEGEALEAFLIPRLRRSNTAPR
jgi:Mn-containing catalase